MGLHAIELPREIVIGDGVINDIGKVCDKLNLSIKKIFLKKAGLILTDQNILKIAGKNVADSLKKSGYSTKIKIVSSGDEKEINKVMKIARKSKFLVGVGGGRIIDIAKYISFKIGVPFISVPTCASHDGIGSSRATFNFNGKHYSFEARSPIAIIVDMNIISKSPYRLVAAGCGDTLAKLTAVSDWKLGNKVNGESFSEYAASMALSSAQVVMDSADSIRKMEKSGLRNLIESLISNGIAMSIAGSSRPASGSEHLFSHALDQLNMNKKSLHGEQCGVGAIMMACLHKSDWRKLRETLKKLNCPINAKELGVENETIIKALVKAKNIRKDRYTILNQINLNKNKAEKLARKTGVI